MRDPDGLVNRNVNVDASEGIGYLAVMTIADFANAHPLLAFLYLVVGLSLLTQVRLVTIRSKSTVDVRDRAADPASAEVEEDEAEPEEEQPERMRIDPENDPAGQERATDAIRIVLASGERTAIVPADLAGPIASTFTDESWRVSSEPVPPGPVLMGPPRPPLARLTFSWLGEAS